MDPTEKSIYDAMHRLNISIDELKVLIIGLLSQHEVTEKPDFSAVGFEIIKRIEAAKSEIDDFVAQNS